MTELSSFVVVNRRHCALKISIQHINTANKRLKLTDVWADEPIVIVVVVVLRTESDGSSPDAVDTTQLPRVTRSVTADHHVITVAPQPRAVRWRHQVRTSSRCKLAHKRLFTWCINSLILLVTHIHCVLSLAQNDARFFIVKNDIKNSLFSLN